MNETLDWADKKMSKYYKDKSEFGFDLAIENVIQDIYNELKPYKEA